MIGYGLSDRATRAFPKTASENNLGGTRLELGDAGTIPVTTGDIAFQEMEFDLVKIDTEGMENAVIDGMAGVLRRSKATVFVEVLFENIDSTISQMKNLGYIYRTSYQRYFRCINLFFGKQQ